MELFGPGVVFPEDFVLVPPQQQIDKIVVINDEKVETNSGNWEHTKAAVIVVWNKGALPGRSVYKISLVYGGGESVSPWLKSSAVERVAGLSLEDLVTSSR